MKFQKHLIFLFLILSSQLIAQTKSSSYPEIVEYLVHDFCVAANNDYRFRINKYIKSYPMKNSIIIDNSSFYKENYVLVPTGLIYWTEKGGYTVTFYRMSPNPDDLTFDKLFIIDFTFHNRELTRILPPMGFITIDFYNMYNENGEITLVTPLKNIVTITTNVEDFNIEPGLIISKLKKFSIELDKREDYISSIKEALKFIMLKNNN